jgi:hypothetical protein
MVGIQDFFHFPDYRQPDKLHVFVQRNADHAVIEQLGIGSITGEKILATAAILTIEITGVIERGTGTVLCDKGFVQGWRE